MTTSTDVSTLGNLDSAMPVLAIEPADSLPTQDTGFDVTALLTIILIIVTFHVLSPALRDDSPTGQAFKAASLRQVITVILGFLSVALFNGERNQRGTTTQAAAQRRLMTGNIAGGLLGLYVVYVVSFVFFGLNIATDTILPTLVELAALLSVVALWQPWNRLTLYQRQMGKLLPPILIFFGVLIFWELFVKIFDIQQFLLPAPSVIIDTFTVNYNRLVNQGWLTFQNALWGFGIGCGAGILFGLVSARFVGFTEALMPYAIAVNSIPIIAFAPITNAWFGVVDPRSKVAIVAILTFFPAMINTVRGLTSADPASLELMRSLAASEIDIFRKLRLPVALPFIFNGLKISNSLSMIGAIVAEYFGGPTTGLGVQISSNAALIRFPLVWSEIIIASILGIIFYFVVSLAERLIMPWHVSFRPRAD
jgi:NitT/TauT family transport system permease protein